jgi:hypothetical protein
MKKGDSAMQEKGRAHLVLLTTSHGMNHVYQLLTPVIIPKITADYGLSNFIAGMLLFSRPHLSCCLAFFE